MFQFLIDSSRPDPLRHYCESCDSCHESIDCPTAGASQEANAASSLAAPVAGQRAGTPPAVFVVSWMERSLRRRVSPWREVVVMFDTYDAAVRAAQSAKARGWCPGIVRRMAR